MRQQKVVNKADMVVLHYKGMHEDGTVFFETNKDTYFQFQVGMNTAIRAIDEAVLGMKIGEKKRVQATPDDGYGERFEEYVYRINKREFPSGLELFIGKEIIMEDTVAKSYFSGIIVEADDTMVTIDTNNPLSGKKITLDIEIIDIIPLESLLPRRPRILTDEEIAEIKKKYEKQEQE